MHKHGFTKRGPHARKLGGPLFSVPKQSDKGYCLSKQSDQGLHFKGRGGVKTHASKPR